MNLPRYYISKTEIASLLEEQLTQAVLTVLQKKIPVIDKNLTHQIAKETYKELHENLTEALENLIEDKVKILTSKRSGW